MLSTKKNIIEDGKYHIADVGKMVYQQFIKNVDRICYNNINSDCRAS